MNKTRWSADARGVGYLSSSGRYPFQVSGAWPSSDFCSMYFRMASHGPSLALRDLRGNDGTQPLEHQIRKYARHCCVACRCEGFDAKRVTTTRLGNRGVSKMHTQQKGRGVGLAQALFEVFGGADPVGWAVL
eukprot:1780944-Rhodomonas_salina.2